MTNLEEAIAQLEAEVEATGTPYVGSILWWVLRARSQGLSLLKALQAKGISDPVVAENFRKKTRLELQTQVRE